MSSTMERDGKQAGVRMCKSYSTFTKLGMLQPKQVLQNEQYF